jgi:hypothetical protein
MEASAMKNKIVWALLAGIGGYQALRQLGTRSGAADDEVNASLPGDELIPHPMVETNHAITIDAPPSMVWPWLIQCGYRGSGRAGWYTDSWLDTILERLVFRSTMPTDLQPEASWRQSADSILPAFQHTTAGDIIPDGPPGSVYFTVRAVEPERAWILYSDTHPKFLTPRFLHGTSLEASGEFTWVFVLHPVEPESTRFILRTRMRFGPPLFRRLILPVLYASEAIFPRLLLNGIKRRAEKWRGVPQDAALTSQRVRLTNELTHTVVSEGGIRQ